MSNRHHTVPILPFPENIGRDYFGAWLSGFVDGEGCFRLSPSYIKGPECKTNAGMRQTPQAYFAMQLRADDKPTLDLIRSYWGCGNLHYGNARPRPGSNSAPRWEIVVGTAGNLQNVLVPHFHKFPLLAKKRSDFLIWEVGVKMCFDASKRKRPGRSGRKVWTEEEVARFDALAALLSQQREYNPRHAP